MPLLIVLGLLVGCGVYEIAESSKPQAKPKSSSQIENMTNEMIGNQKVNAEKFCVNIDRRDYMSLLLFILMLLVLVGYAIAKAIQPQNPPIENMEKHLKTIQSLPNQKARQKYLRDIGKQ